LKGLTHQLIAAYAGTCRETVTTELNRLRQRGAIGYERVYIDINKDSLAAESRAEGMESFWPPALNQLAEKEVYTPNKATYAG
jgi:hypothetical protein